MRNAGLEEAQAGIKIAGRNINNLRHADETTFMAESKQLKNNLIKMIYSISRSAHNYLFNVTAAVKLKDAYSLEEKLWPT